MAKAKQKSKTKPVALASAAAMAGKALAARLQKPKPKPKRAKKAAKVAIPGLLAIGAGGAVFKFLKGGSQRRSRNFSLVGGAGPAPTTNSQTPSTGGTAPTATEGWTKK